MSDIDNQKEIDYYYCYNCGFRISPVEYEDLRFNIPCPGRGRNQCGVPMSQFKFAYKKADNE